MTDIFEPKPYRLLNKIQHYVWGGKNERAFIPNLLGMDAELDKPYAELWIGAHPKAPSEIIVNNENVALNNIVDKFPIECLGTYAANKFANKFPFLLKVLSSEEALSIQTHPNKSQAEKLHASDSINYPDDNHKPEIAIALDSLSAIAGFKPVDEIIANLKTYPEILNFIGIETVGNIFSINDSIKKEEIVRNIYSKMMKKNKELENLSKCINTILSKLKTKVHLTVEETQFIEQYKVYGADVGLLSFFFFNFINLKSGQAIFTEAGVPHAYIKGNIVECMANSDNVVRAGLTNKFKDVDTLLEILKCNFSEYTILNKEQLLDSVTFNTDAEEFEVSMYQKDGSYTEEVFSNDKPLVYFVINGQMEVEWNSNSGSKTIQFKKGEAFLIPAFLEKFKVLVENKAKYFVVRIP